MNNKWFGAHVSAAGGLERSVERAAKIGANAFAIFTKNQRQWHARSLSVNEIDQFKQELHRYHINANQVLPHGSYLINLGSPNELVRQRSLDALCDELARVQALGIPGLNIHPGSSLGAMDEHACLHQISQLIVQALQRVPEVSVILENTAGQGSCLGHRLEHLAEIIAHIPSQFRHRIGVCLDTCHAFAAGYPLNTLSECEKFFENFETLIGWNYLKGLHLNDSKTGCGSRVDRHASLGKGHIGLPLFSMIARQSRFCRLPLILETPDPQLWPEEIAWLKHQSHEESNEKTS